MSIDSIDILRHGEPQSHQQHEPRFIGSLDVEVSTRGWQRMQEAIKQHDQDWDLIISSPLRRCSLFAEAQAAARNIPCLLLSNLREYHFGVWEGQYLKDISLRNERSLQAFWSDPDTYAPTGAESMQDFRQRLQSVWNSILDYQGYRKILIISHGGVMRQLYAMLTGEASKHFLEYQPAYASMLHIGRQSAQMQAKASLLQSTGTCAR